MVLNSSLFEFALTPEKKVGSIRSERLLPDRIQDVEGFEPSHAAASFAFRLETSLQPRSMDPASRISSQTVAPSVN